MLPAICPPRFLGGYEATVHGKLPVPFGLAQFQGLDANRGQEHAWRGLRRASVLDCGDERSESPLWLRFGNILTAHHAKAAIAQTPSPQSKTWRIFPYSSRILHEPVDERFMKSPIAGKIRPRLHRRSYALVPNTAQKLCNQS